MYVFVSVKNVLHHFAISHEATRVAIVTYSTTATVDVNYVSNADEHVTKCDVYRRISEALENIEPRNHAATGDALRVVYELLLDSRASTKKAIVLITDSRLPDLIVVPSAFANLKSVHIVSCQTFNRRSCVI